MPPRPVESFKAMNQRLLVIDVETSGLDPHVHSLLSLGAVVWEDESILDAIEIFVRESVIVWMPEAVAIHGITPEWVQRNGMSPEEAWLGFDGFLRKHFPRSGGEKVTLVAHNAGFDVQFLRRLYRLANASYDEVFSYRVVDTAGILRFLDLAEWVELGAPSLNDGLQYFDIVLAPGERHTALGDATATARLLTCLVRRVQGNRVVRTLASRGDELDA
jgi:DNA polymerase III epsilon subunit-like protein